MSNRAAVILVLDRSASMAKVRKPTVTLVNEFLDDQRALDDDVEFTLVTFNHDHSLRFDGVPIADVPALTEDDYKPEGWTALLDAVGFTIDHAGARFAAMPEDQRPTKVFLAIQTDGEENSSKRETHQSVAERIHRQSEEWNWQIIFLGADQEAWEQAARMGMSRGQTVSYDSTAVGTQAVSQVLRSARADYMDRGTASADALGHDGVDLRSDGSNTVSTSTSKPDPAKTGKRKPRATASWR